MSGSGAATDLVLVGGGHAHVHVLKSFGMTPEAGVRVTLVSREAETPYSGMLPGLIAGHYAHDECHIDLYRLARFAGARLLIAEAVGIDRAERRLLLRGRPPLHYDLLSLDIGSTPKLAVPGAAEHAIPVKPIAEFEPRWLCLIERARAAKEALRIVTVGGGAGGVELTLAMQHRLAGEREVAPPRFALATRRSVLPRHNASMRRALRRTLEKRSIAVHENAEVIRVEPHALCCADGRRIAFDELLWVTQAGAAPWLAETGLALDKRGFLALEATLRSMTDPRIFGAGDVATVLPHKRPKAGVFAVRQGPPLADNLRRAAASKGLCPFVPQRHFLSIIGTGEDNAVAARGGLAVEGRWVWRWKEWIDRRWIRRYQDLPPMPARAASSAEDAMRCGGCGAKIASPILARVLARLDPASGSDVELGIGDDAAVLRLPPDRLMLQTADFFRSFVGDPYLFGRIAANHALGDVYAMGGAPMSALAIAAVPHNAEPIVEDELFQMLSGAKETLDAAEARLVGGHSAEGGELALGFAVTGTAPSGRILRKGGLRAGDRLVLTKPLGTGVLFAAEMRGAAKARWVEAALEAMQQNAADAASCLLAHGATGCTDVTGFGLGGHLLEMLRASGVGAVLLPDAVPVLAGVREMVRAGIASTLAPANEAATRPWIAAEADLVDPLLFDPQTAGGLLAGVPEARAEACVTALRRLGYAHATVIGAVMAIESGERSLHVVARLPAREAAAVAGE